MDITKLYKTQISLSEWLEKIDFGQAEAFRKEDNEKRKTLAKLNQIIGLPFDQPTEFTALDLATPSEKFSDYLKNHGTELCALRLIPLGDDLPKLRMRGHTVNDAMKWFHEQKIDPTKYRADIVPHSETSRWSTIFIVNKNGIFGEIIQGGHHQLTQGFYESEPITFSFNFVNWQLNQNDSEALQHLQDIMKKIFVSDKEKQNQVEEKLAGKFFNNYLAGYFETVDSAEFGLWFIDWNKILGEMYSEYTPTNPIATNNTNTLTGQVGFAGKVRGKVRIVSDLTLTPNPSLLVERGTREAGGECSDDWILVCPMTTPEYLPLMKTCAGIITEQGGILSHAAIISRELKKPCVVGVKNATNILQEGEVIEIDNETIKMLARP